MVISRLPRGILAQASVQNHLGNSALPSTSPTDVVSFQSGNGLILSNGENAGSAGPGAISFIFGAGGHENVLLSIEANESSRTNRILPEWPT